MRNETYREEQNKRNRKKEKRAKHRKHGTRKWNTDDRGKMRFGRDIKG